MILSNKRNLFGKCGRIQTIAYECIVSTAKEGLFKRFSTVILEGNSGSLATEMRPCGKLIYADALGGKERLQIHDCLVNFLDESGDDTGMMLGDSLEVIFGDFKKRGVAKEVINIAEKAL